MASFTDPLPCGPYTTPERLLECCPAANKAGLDVNSVQVLDAIADASLLLYYWTGRTYGVCDSTLRVAVTDRCDPCVPKRIDLGLWPITTLSAVRVDTVAQDVADYRIEDFHYLASTTEFEPHTTVEVDVTYGVAAPGLLERATRVMACELLNDSCIGDCSLPDRVTSVSRRGLTQTIASSEDLLGSGLTGIFVVDLAIKTLNPSRLQSPSFAWNPGLNRNRVSRIG